MGLPTLRTDVVKLLRENEVQFSRNLDLIKKTRDVMALEIEGYQKMAQRFHASKIWLRRFQEEDWVLKRNLIQTGDGLRDC